MREKIMGARTWVAALAVGAAVFAAAGAGPIITPAGTTLGFSLSHYFVDSQYYGILGVTSGPGGAIYGAGYSYGKVIKLPDTDGVTYADAITTASTPGTPTGMAYAGGNLYLGILGGGYYSVDPTTLALTPLSLSQSVSHAYGLWANPVTGHLLAGDSYGMLDIDPLTGIVTVVGPGGLDGVTVSPDGKTGYGEYGGAFIKGYDLVTPNPGTAVFTSPVIPGGPDGTGIITGGALNGDIIVNANNGDIILLDPTTGTQTVIASGGSRGDLVGPDFTNGTLLLDFAYDGLWRLAYAGGSIGGGGGGNEGVPEPATLLLLGAGLAGVAGIRRRRKNAV
jgi:hypothetical protein